MRARVNGNLAFEFTDARLTSYAGLQLFDRYLRQTGFSQLVRVAFSDARLGGDFGVIAMVRMLIGLLMVGGRRLDHLRYLATDPLLRRFARVRVWPTARTVSRWLKRFTMKSVEQLMALNAAVIAQILPRLQLRTLTVDVDGVVVSTGLQVERAAQLKSGLAFHTVPTLAYAANSAWQQLVALTHNLLTNFQIDTDAEQRSRSRKHTALSRLSTVQTLRFTLPSLGTARPTGGKVDLAPGEEPSGGGLVHAHRTEASSLCSLSI